VSATSDSSVAGQRFEETAWSVVLAAGEKSGVHAQAALGELCRVYWRPIYAYLRRRGYQAEDAQDLTQSFFQHVLENATLRRVARDKGRFRSFLLGALKLCLADEHACRRSLKRGGGFHFISVDELEAEEMHHLQMSRDLSADELLDARWAGVLLERALQSVRTEFAAADKTTTFERLSVFLDGDKPDVSYDEVATALGVSLGAIKSLIHRLRQQFAAALRREIMQTVNAPHEVNDELRRLRAVFARAGERQAA
jgi:RNA polymerase sigma-70 factor (ECF subfamily)